MALPTRTKIPPAGANARMVEHNLYDFRSLYPTAGNIFFVHSSGSSTGSGLSPEDAISTLNGAVALCTASQNDVIIVLPGHAETVTSTSTTLSVAGVTVMGLGNGLNRPVFTFATAAATINVSAANVKITGCDFLATFADVAAAFTVAAAKDFHVDNCTFRDTDSTHNFLSCVVTGSTNNAADGLRFTRNTVRSLPATDGAVVSVLGNLDRLILADNVVDKAATNNAGHFLTLSSKIIGSAQIVRNICTVIGATNATVGIFLTGSGTTSTGVVAYNLVSSLDSTSALIATAGTGLAYFENYLVADADGSGLLWPAAGNPG